MKNIWFEESDLILRRGFGVDSTEKIADRINAFLLRHYKQIGRKQMVTATVGSIMFRAAFLNLLSQEQYVQWLSERHKQQRKIRNTIGKVDAADRQKVFERDKNCVKCGDISDLTIDHIKSVRFGGTGHFNNLQVLCRSCNSSKNAGE